MFESLYPWMGLIGFIAGGMGCYFGLRAKAHTLWNAEDIAAVLEFLMQQFPEELQAFLQGAGSVDAWEPEPMIEAEIPEEITQELEQLAQEAPA